MKGRQWTQVLVWKYLRRQKVPWVLGPLGLITGKASMEAGGHFHGLGWSLQQKSQIPTIILGMVELTRGSGVRISAGIGGRAPLIRV